MAKKKNASDVEAVYDIDKFLSELEDEFGEGVVVAGENILSKRPMIISFSPAIDLALGGGIPTSSWVTISGAPKVGKSTSAIHFAVKAQRPEYGNRHVFYLNVEGRLKAMNLEGVPGIDLSRFHVIQSTKNKLLDAKQFLNIGVRILKNNPGCILIIDSLSAMAHEKELVEGVGAFTRGSTQVLINQFCREVSQIIPHNDSIIISMTHIMANVTGYGSPTMEKSGFGAQYQADVKLRCKGKPEPWKISTTGKQIGQIVSWVADFTALGAPPGTEFESYVRYGIGIDECMELIVLGMDFGIIEGSTWLSFNEQKFQGKENLREYLINNTEAQKDLYSKIKEIIS